MLTHVAGRILAAVPVLIGVTIAVFSMLFLVPGDPVKMMLAEFVTTPDQVAQMRAQLHLDDPIPVQYGRFVANALRGDLGTSIRSRRPVTQEIGENLAKTVQLAVASMAVALSLGLALGILAALLRNSWLDVGAMAVAMVGVSMPSFWPGLLLIFVFSLHLGWFPATGGDGLVRLVLPALTLGTIAAAIIARLTRSSMLEVLGQDYIRTAQARKTFEGLRGAGIRGAGRRGGGRRSARAGRARRSAVADGGAQPVHAGLGDVTVKAPSVPVVSAISFRLSR